MDKIRKDLKWDNTITLLEEMGKINIDNIDCNLEDLVNVLESDYNMNVEIKQKIGGYYLVNNDFRDFRRY